MERGGGGGGAKRRKGKKKIKKEKEAETNQIRGEAAEKEMKTKSRKEMRK